MPPDMGVESRPSKRWRKEMAKAEVRVPMGIPEVRDLCSPLIFTCIRALSFDSLRLWLEKVGAFGLERIIGFRPEIVTGFRDIHALAKPSSRWGCSITVSRFAGQRMQYEVPDTQLSARIEVCWRLALPNAYGNCQPEENQALAFAHFGVSLSLPI